MSRRSHTQAATTAALSWNIYEMDAFNVPRIDIVLATAPVSAGTLQVRKDSVAGAAYDSVIRVVNPVGKTSIAIEGLHGFVQGDKLVVEYDNPDNVSITGTASVELLTNADLIGSGLTAEGGIIRSAGANYRRYYHIPLESTNPGASGATRVPASATVLSGYKLDADTEKLECSTDIHGDWATEYNPTMEFTFTVNVDNGAGAASDTVDFQILMYYRRAGDAVVRTQTITGSIVVGACDQYTQFEVEVDMDKDATDNPILPSDKIDFVLSCPATGNITDITVNAMSVSYPTTHVGIESGDV